MSIHATNADMKTARCLNSGKSSPMRFLPIPDKDNTTGTLMMLGVLFLCVIAGLIFRLGVGFQQLSRWINRRVDTLCRRMKR